MKLMMKCTRCTYENPNQDTQLIMVEIQDDNLYRLTCPLGHQEITLLLHQKFEILFEVGATAIIDGYHREAVSAFSACLERFHEYYIQVICCHHNIPDVEFSNAWKLIGNLSERQLGGFISLFLLERKQCPQHLIQTSIQFRNDVIHKGKFPTKDEAMKFGKEVLQIVNTLLFQLKKDYLSEVKIIGTSNFVELNRKIDNSILTTAVSYPTIVSISRINEQSPRIDFESEFLELNKRYQKIKSARRA